MAGALVWEGCSGGVGGSAFDDNEGGADLRNCRVLAIRIRSGAWIDAIQTTVQNKDTGQVTDLPRHGGGGGGENVISVSPNQFVSQIFGGRDTLVRSMSIRLMDNDGNQQLHGPFGGGGSKNYQYDTPHFPNNDNTIIGFWGSWGAFLDEIGVIVLRPR